MTIAGGTRLGVYEVLAFIGAGGMGEVYKARDTRLGRVVAVKVLRDHLVGQADRRARFEREARTISRLSHPNICAFFDAGHDNGTDYLVVEYLEGQSLAERLQKGALTIEQTVTIAVAVASALDAAHRAGIVHRDLKPANVMLTKTGAKLLDFGVASISMDAAQVAFAGGTERTLTATGTLVGTVQYMSPEQLDGRDADARSDLFSFGAMLYEMLTGRRAFQGENQSRVIVAVLESEPPSIASVRPGVPPALERIVTACLAKDPAMRWQSAADLARSLAWVKAEGANHEIAFYGRRRRLGWATSMVMAILGIAALGFALLERDHRSSGSATVSPRGEHLQIEQLTASGGACGPGISPDGRYVAYVQQRVGLASVFIRQTAGAGQIQVVPPEPGVSVLGARFGPDGTFVDYVRRADGAPKAELWRVSSLGGTPKRLIDDISSYVTWSPDGRHLAFLRTDVVQGSYALIVAEPDGSHERVLAVRHRPLAFETLNNSANNPPPLAWSPDGRIIALEEFNPSEAPNGTFHIVFIDTQAVTERHSRIAAMGLSAGMAWADNGTLLVSQGFQLWQLSYPAGTWSRRTADLSSYSHISLSADGNSLVTCRADDLASIWVGAATGENARQLVSSGGNRVAWAGQRLLYYSTARRSIMSLEPDSGKAPEEFISHAGEPSATADGRVTVFAKTDVNGIWRADASGRNLEQVVEGVAGLPQVTPDGRWVLFLARSNGRQSLWMAPADGGTPRQVTNEFVEGVPARVSPDSRLLAFSSGANWIMCQLPACSSRRALVVPTMNVRWTPDGRGIAFAENRPPNLPNLWVQPLDGSPRRQLTRLTDETPIVDFAWSHDGTRLAIARVKRTRDIVLFTGLLR
jgi:Tol biopolymer transport system component/tRNA A-37 threonylcarbamoyl transferase component Bud32